MGPENVLATIAGIVLQKVQIHLLLAIAFIALSWLIYRDFVWNKIK